MSEQPDPIPTASPQGKLAAEKAARALNLAVAAVDEPLFPELGARCPRCGQRLETKEGAPATTCPRCKVVTKSADSGKILITSRGMVGEIFQGISYVPRGFFKIMGTPRLWKFAVIPFILNVLALLLAFYIADQFVAAWLDGIDQRWTAAGGVWKVLSYGIEALEILSRILIPLVMGLLIVFPPFDIIYKLIFMPFMELMTEATDQVVLGFKDESKFEFAKVFANTVMAIFDAILVSLLQLVIIVLLLPINLIPFVGSAVWAILPPSAFACMDYTDINLVRRGYTTREKMRLWWTYQWRFFGYGLSFFFLLTIPLVNCFVIPSAAVGGALLYLELERK